MDIEVSVKCHDIGVGWGYIWKESTISKMLTFDNNNNNNDVLYSAHGAFAENIIDK